MLTLTLVIDLVLQFIVTLTLVIDFYLLFFCFKFGMLKGLQIDLQIGGTSPSCQNLVKWSIKYSRKSQNNNFLLGYVYLKAFEL